MLIKTTPRNAVGIVCFIDSMEKQEILGTIAGYDTNFYWSRKKQNILQAESN